MRYINLYLLGNVIYVVGVVLAVWRVGVFQQVGTLWVVIGLVIAIGLGVMLAVSAGKPTITRERDS